MSSNDYIRGEVAQVYTEVTDAAGAATDPAMLRLIVRPPVGAAVTYTLGQPDVVRDAAGAYHVDVVVNQSGQWRYRWESDAPNQGASEGVFVVRRSLVL